MVGRCLRVFKELMETRSSNESLQVVSPYVAIFVQVYSLYKYPRVLNGSLLVDLGVDKLGEKAYADEVRVSFISSLVC